MRWGIALAGNIKVLGRAVQSLSRFAEEVYLEIDDKGIIFRAVNASRCAYAYFTFHPQFFAEFISGTTKGPVLCKVLIKGLMLPFKSISNIEKNVEKCSFDINRGDDTLLIRLECKYGVIKTYSIPLIEYETLNSLLQQNSYPITISAKSKVVADLVQNFSLEVEEVTLSVSEDKVLLKTCVENEPDPLQVVRTAVQFEAEEFENVHLKAGETNVTFCLKELKAILFFAEVCSSSIAIQIEKPGAPILFSVKSQQGYEASFFLASLVEDNDNPATQESWSAREQQKEPSRQEIPERSSQTEAVPGPSVSVSLAKDSSKNHQNSLFQQDWRTGNVDSENYTYQGSEDEENIPGTPPHKKFRYQFLGISEAQKGYTSVLPDDDVVLVPASDDEDSS